MTLNANAQEWVNDLRSGKYKQAKNQLSNGHGGYCCLGVACLTYQRVTGAPLSPLWRRRGDLYHATSSYDEITNWLGLSESSGDYWRGNVKHSLASDNDEGKPFSEIADIIESEPEGLFK